MAEVAWDSSCGLKRAEGGKQGRQGALVVERRETVEEQRSTRAGPTPAPFAVQEGGAVRGVRCNRSSCITPAQRTLPASRGSSLQSSRSTSRKRLVSRRILPNASAPASLLPNVLTPIPHFPLDLLSIRIPLRKELERRLGGRRGRGNDDELAVRGGEGEEGVGLGVEPSTELWTVFFRSASAGMGGGSGGKGRERGRTGMKQCSRCPKS